MSAPRKRRRLPHPDGAVHNAPAYDRVDDSRIHGADDEAEEETEAPPPRRLPPPLFDARLDLGTTEGQIHAAEELMEGLRIRRVKPNEIVAAAKLMQVVGGVVAARDRTRALALLRGGGPPVRGVGVSSPFGALPVRGTPVRALPAPPPLTHDPPGGPFGHPIARNIPTPDRIPEKVDALEEGEE